MLRTRLSIAALLTCQTALCTPLMAQEAATGTEFLGEIILQSNGATGPVNGANPATLTGSKTATPVTEVPQSVSVIPADTLKAMNASKLDGVLSYTAGVTGQPYGYDSDTNWVFIRGFNATQSGAFQDGLPNYAYGFGGFYIDPLLVERVEVLKGASSVLYGGSNPGGLVNYVTKAPTGENTTELEFGFNEYGRVWTSIDKNGRLSDSLAFRVLGKIERVDSEGAFDAGLNLLLSGSMEHTFDNGGRLTYGLDLLRVDEAHVAGGWLPYVGTVVDAPFGRIDRDLNVGEPGHDRYERDQAALRMSWTQDLGGWTLSNNARLAVSDVAEDSVIAYGYTGYSLTPVDAAGTLQRGVFDHRTETTQFGNDTRVERTLAWGGTEHRLMFGMDVKYFRMDILEGSNHWSGPAVPGLEVTNPVYGGALPGMTPYKDVLITQRQLGVYAQDQIRWGQGWLATANMRYDWVETEASADPAAGNPGSKRKDGEATWRLGLAKELSTGLTAYASASTFFNPVVEPTTAGNDIKPESGRQFELGVKWAPSDDFLLTAAVFDLTRENVSQSMWNGAGYTFSQIGEVRSRGFELEAKGKIAEGLDLHASVTKMDIEILNDQSAALIGKMPMATSDESAALKLVWTPVSAPEWTLTGGIRYTGASFADQANTLKVPSFTLLDLGASYTFANDWTANLAITNVTDKTYVASCQITTSPACYYGEGRAASISFRKSF